MKGKVIQSGGLWYKILGEDKEVYTGRLKRSFKLREEKENNPLAVGDVVHFANHDNTDDTVVISEIEERENYFLRRSAHKTGHYHVMAANIDQAVLIAPLEQPKTPQGFIDRFLVICEAFEVPPVVVFNKSDLLKKKSGEKLDELSALYDALGYKVLVTSAENGEGLQAFKDILKGRTTLLAGHSGAGKSSLLNKVFPDLNLKTSSISSYWKKGRHTTTAARMHIPDQDTFVIDSPGLKELGLESVEVLNLGLYFPEFREYSGQCRFYDCTHIHEPDCAVKRALEEEKIDEGRYNSYARMLRELQEKE